MWHEVQTGLVHLPCSLRILTESKNVLLTIIAFLLDQCYRTTVVMQQLALSLTASLPQTRLVSHHKFP